jgi:PBSX family phage terminase large subunit
MEQAGFQSGNNGFEKNETKMHWKFPNGSMIICGGANDPGKLHGLEQDITFLNEVMMIPKSALDQLEYRTRVGFIFDWNPSLNDHWVFKNGFDKTHNYGDDERLAGKPKCLYFHSTYRDNLENLNDAQISGIEQYEPTAGNIARGTADAYMWSVYGLGKRGFIEGRVISAEKVEVVSDGDFPSPSQWELHGYGLDWGFSQDPTALVECAIFNKKIYVRELIYEKNLIVSPDPTLPHARSVIGLLREINIKATDTIVADSARPDLNAALRNAGYQVLDAYKPGGSIENGVNLMNQRRWCVTDSSFNVKFELENWTWSKTRYGEQTRKPIDKHNHCLVGGTKIKTSRGNVKIKDVVAGDYVLTRKGYRRVLRAWQSGKNRKVFKLTISNGSRIVGTGNHLVLTLRGFVPIEDVRIGDKVLCIKKKSKPMARRGIGIRSHKDEQTGNISAEEINSFTTTFGKRLLVNAGKALSSITRMVIAKITPLKTLKRFLRRNTWERDTSPQGRVSKHPEGTFSLLARKLLSGIIALKESLGTKSMQSASGLEASRSSEGLANVAGKSSTLCHSSKNSAQTTVSPQCDDDSDLITLLNIANSAEESSKATNIRKSDFVVGVVQEKVSLKRKAPAVYDLTVDEEHEFFANGVLVHNCMDAVRYWLTSFVGSDNVARMGNAEQDSAAFRQSYTCVIDDWGF